MLGRLTFFSRFAYVLDLLLFNQGTSSEVEAHENDLSSFAHHLQLACKVISDKTREILTLKAELQRKDALLAARNGYNQSQRIQQTDAIGRLSREQLTEDTDPTSTGLNGSNQFVDAQLYQLCPFIMSHRPSPQVVMDPR